MPLLALQRYVPSLVLFLGRLNCSPVNSTSLSLPLADSFVQVMFGAGSPSAVQVKLIGGPPSSTTWSGAFVASEGGSTKELRIKERYFYQMFDHTTLKKKEVKIRISTNYMNCTEFVVLIFLTYFLIIDWTQTVFNTYRIQ